MRELPLPPDRGDRADARRDARQLRDEAALRQPARDHARPRPGAGDHARRQHASCSTRSTTRPRRSTRRRCSRCSSPTSRGSRSCSAARSSRPPEPELALGQPRRAAGRAARPLLDAFDGDHAQGRCAFAELSSLPGTRATRRSASPFRGPGTSRTTNRLGRRVAFEDGELAAAGDEAAAAGGDGAGRRGLVLLVLLRIVDVGLDDEICRHVSGTLRFVRR